MNHYDEAALWLHLAWRHVERARSVIAAGRDSGKLRALAWAEAWAADALLLDALRELAEEWSGARVASLVYERIAASGRDESLEGARAMAGRWRAFAAHYGRHRG